MHFTKAALALSFSALFAVACGGPPKQADTPEPLSDQGADMSGGEDATNGGTVAPAEGGQSGEEQMHAKCCGQCKEGLAKDRTGQDPKGIPCADYTDTLDPFCLEHFRGKPTMAAECK